MCITSPNAEKKVKKSSNLTMIKRFCSNCIFLTIFAVDFDRVGGKLERRSTLACLRKPEVLHLTISAQHVHIQH